MNPAFLFATLVCCGIPLVSCESTASQNPEEQQESKRAAVDLRKSLAQNLQSESKHTKVERKTALASPVVLKEGNKIDEQPRDFLSSRFRGSFIQDDRFTEDFFDPSTNGGFGNPPDLPKQESVSRPHSHFEPPGKDAKEHPSVNFHGRHPDPSVSNPVDAKSKPKLRKRPLRDNPIRPTTSGSTRVATLQEVPRPFQHADADFRRLQPLTPERQDKNRFFQSTIAPSITGRPGVSPAVINKGIPLDVANGALRPGFPGVPGSQTNPPLPGVVDTGLNDPFIDPDRYRLLQQIFLEEQLRAQHTTSGPGLTQRPNLFYPQQQFGYPQTAVPLDVPGAGSGLQPDIPVDDYSASDAFIPRCAQVYDDAYGHYNQTYCLYDPEYPTLEVVQAIRRSPRTTHRLFSDVTYQSADDLIDGLTKQEEETYSYDHYFGQRQSSRFQNQQGRSNYGHDPNQQRGAGYVCSSRINYGRPKRAMNVRGEWKVIVNLADEQRVPYDLRRFTQTQRMERCLYPDNSCNYIGANFNSRCLQKHNYVRMVAFHPLEGLHVDSFRVPVACSCFVGTRRLISGYPDNIHALSGGDNQKDLD